MSDNENSAPMEVPGQPGRMRRPSGGFGKMTERWVRIIKASGATITAIAAFAAMIIAVYREYNPPPENVAKESYKATSKVIGTMSNNIKLLEQQLHNQRRQFAARVKSLQGEMQQFLAGVAHGMALSKTGAGGKTQREINQKLLQALSKKAAGGSGDSDAKSTPPPAPAPRITQQRKLPSIDTIQRRAKKKAAE